MNNEDLDHMFDAAFEHAAKKLPSPDPGPSWEKIQSALLQRKQKRKPRVLPITAAAVSFLIGAFVFSSPTVSTAFDPVVASMRNIQADIVSIIFSNRSEHAGKAKTDPPPDRANNDHVIGQADSEKSVFDSWEKASANLAFHAPSITFIPDPFKLNNVILFSNQQEKAKKAVLFYNTKNSSFMLTIRILEKGEILTTSSESSAGRYELIDINGEKGYLFNHIDGRTSLDYLYGSLVVSIAGSLTKDQIIQVANGIK